MSRKETILIIDDEVGPRESLRLILKSHYEIMTAADGQEALRIIRDREIDLVTLDLNMPGLSGLEVLKEIQKLRPDTEVIIITGFGNLPNAQESIRFGAGNFISKPFNIAEIVTIVGKAFERRRYNLRIMDLVKKIKGLGSSAVKTEDFCSDGAEEPDHSLHASEKMPI